jgi:hypothetical protein
MTKVETVRGTRVHLVDVIPVNRSGSDLFEKGYNLTFLSAQGKGTENEHRYHGWVSMGGLDNPEHASTVTVWENQQSTIEHCLWDNDGKLDKQSAVRYVRHVLDAHIALSEVDGKQQ